MSNLGIGWNKFHILNEEIMINTAETMDTLSMFHQNEDIKLFGFSLEYKFIFFFFCFFFFLPGAT